jgi:hypothetical protein
MKERAIGIIKPEAQPAHWDNTVGLANQVCLQHARVLCNMEKIGSWCGTL